MDFHLTNGRNSSALVSTCHLVISIPRRLADKRSDSQPTSISHNVLPSNCTKSMFHSKSKEVRFDTSPEIHVYRHGISDRRKYSQGTSTPSRFSNSDYQNISFSDSSLGTNFPFSFGQTQCSSRLRSPRQTSLTTSGNVTVICLETSHSSSPSSGSDQQYESTHLKWWMDTNCFVQGTSFHSPDPNAFLFTDVSHNGWGAHLELMRLSFHGRWSEDQSQLHINMLEIMAIPFALKKAIIYIDHSCVMISTDNTTVVSYINKQGGMGDPPCRGMGDPPLVSNTEG